MPWTRVAKPIAGEAKEAPRKEREGERRPEVAPGRMAKKSRKDQPYGSHTQREGKRSSLEKRLVVGLY